MPGCIYQRDHLQNTCLGGSIKETIFKVHVWMDPSKRPSSKYMTGGSIKETIFKVHAWVESIKRDHLSKYILGWIYERDHLQITCLGVSIRETIFKIHAWLDLSKRPSSKYMSGWINQRDHLQST